MALATQAAANERELATERTRRADAEKRAAQAAADLARIAAVKQETRGTVITLSGSVLFASNKYALLPAAQVKLGFTSCANYERGYFTGYRHLAAEQPDLVLMLGDYIYEQVEKNRPVLRRHSDNEVPTTLDGYRRRYAQYRLDPDLQNLHAVAPTLVTWDDHEVENDYAGDWSEKFTPQATFARQRQAAYRAFYDHMPVRNRPTATGLDIYDSVTIGDLARISLLDGRQYRTRGACYATPNQGGGHQVDSVTCPELLDPSRSMLGLRQEQWLGGNLATSPARWNIVR